MTHALELAIGRLESILSAETNALAEARFSEVAELTARKNRSLLELTRLGRGFAAAPADPSMKAKLAALGVAVENNRRVLDLHVKASNEIAAVISASIAKAESDGTYGARAGRDAAAAGSAR